jgi:hypothetical protein
LVNFGAGRDLRNWLETNQAVRTHYAGISYARMAAVESLISKTELTAVRVERGRGQPRELQKGTH